MDELRDCPDCGVAPGIMHQDGCDVERCPWCGGQLLSCSCCCVEERAEWIAQHRMVWTGQWPGIVDCERLGFFCYWNPAGKGDPEQNYGWVRVDKDHPKATADLNRLYMDCVWNREEARFELKEKS